MEVLPGTPGGDTYLKLPCTARKWQRLKFPFSQHLIYILLFSEDTRYAKICGTDKNIRFQFGHDE